MSLIIIRSCWSWWDTMKLKTSLQLSAIFPLVFAIVITLSLRWWLNSGERSETLAIIFLSLTGLLGLVMTALIIYYTKDILGKIKTLNEWTETVLKGNLDAAVDLKPSDDEVSRLSYALSRMLREIKQAYSEVHKEASEHKQQSLEQKRLAEAAQVGTKQLSDALNRLKESQHEIMQKERLHVYEQVIRGVVHDFGEALTPLMGTIDILKACPEKVQDQGVMAQHLQVMSEAVHNARKSIKHLAGIYRVHQERASGAVDINRVIERVISLLEPRWKNEARARGVKIDVRSDLQSVPSVAVDESDIQDVITNLLMNSIEAMPDGGTITISTYADKAFVTLDVRDTGRGMTDEVHRRCLEPFYTTKSVAGTGMGLTIVHSVVQVHKGTLKIETAPGKGVRVVIKLPVWSEMLRKQKTVENVRLDNSRMSILLVDDDPLSLKVLAGNLSFYGYDVTPVTSGQEALARFKERQFDVIIADKAMPGMDGVALAGAVKELSPGTPVIMLTGYADVMKEEGDIPAVIDYLLSKPTTMEDLGRALANVAGIKK